MRRGSSRIPTPFPPTGIGCNSSSYPDESKLPWKASSGGPERDNLRDEVESATERPAGRVLGATEQLTHAQEPTGTKELRDDG